MSDFVTVETETIDSIPVAILTLNRPELHNPVNEPTIAALEEQIEAIVSGRQHRAIVVTGAGKSFSSGGDLKGYQDLFRDRDRFENFVQAFGRVCLQLERSPILTVAMVNGTCMAGGMELALSCDLIVVSTTAKIGDGHLRFSQMPGSGCQRLVRAIGLQRARHWMYSGDLHTAEAAVDVGLAVAALEPEELREGTLKEIARICQASPEAMRRVKQLLVTAATTPLDDGLEIEEAMAVSYATTSPDAIEGIMAFAEKRSPRFEPL